MFCESSINEFSRRCTNSIQSSLGLALLNLVFLLVLDDELAVVWTSIMRASFGIIGSRIILNLNEAASPDKPESWELSQLSFSDRTETDGSGTLVSKGSTSKYLNNP